MEGEGQGGGGNIRVFMALSFFIISIFYKNLLHVLIKAVLMSFNGFCIPKSFNTNISQKFLLQDILCEFTTREQKLKRGFCSQKPFFTYTEINLRQK